MSTVRLVMACGDYDITRPLVDGVVTPKGVDLVTMTYPSPQRHWRMLKHHEFDIAEMSLGSFVAKRSRGEDDLVAIPVFPHRRFRHGYAFVSAAAGVTEAADFAGRTVGVRSWQTTAGVWLRGILAEHHGMDLTAVRWIAQDGEDVPLELPPGLSLETVTPGEDVVNGCVNGDVAGLIYPELPGPVLAGEPTIRRIFPDPRQAEQDYYRSTGIFPIMHVVAIRADVAERYPWLPRNLMDAFDAAKATAMRRLQDPRTVSLAWLRALQEEERALLGPDPWHYGLDDSNAHTLQTFLRYALEQGVASRALTPEELFHPATLENPPAYV
ncbi:4,5-dihydroxyphthalate decarboxylase [Blastococcus saxobsidens]|uniref:4,5-dihydroxyphthalate decarboxylase n=1 Tax=Blastococcus saxobsidens TaxID=138336 RepID=A0A4V2G2J9_9ACTN|nr:4,5-dihydroxyphthalate decarboxylase [Blastococcus saxobsidens]RZU33456.1 4,5-dihydroxyphthalate decarboxylase [Blastococcus saxobsidens]